MERSPVHDPGRVYFLKPTDLTPNGPYLWEIRELRVVSSNYQKYHVPGVGPEGGGVAEERDLPERGTQSRISCLDSDRS